MICDLPTELHQCIADQVSSDADLNALVRSNKSIYNSLNAHLYFSDVTRGHDAALLWAASHGQLSTARKALAAGANINSRAGLNGTAIHIAAGGGHLQVLKLLLAVEGADPNAKDKSSGVTPLCRAAVSGQDHVIEYLIYSCGADPNLSSIFHQKTPLILATEAKTVKTLLATGRVNVNQQDIATNSPLLQACTSGYVEIVKLLIAEETCDVNLQNNKGFAPLTQAVSCCHPEIVRILVSVDGIDINICDETQTLPPLIIAIRNGYTDIVRILLETGKANLGYCGGVFSSSTTPLLCAAEHSDEDIVRLLLAMPGVELDAQGAHEYTPLLWSALQGNYSIFRMLLDAGNVNLNAKDDNGTSVLGWALESGSYEMVEDLIKSGQVSLTTGHPQPLLWVAANSEHWEPSVHVKVLKLLLDCNEVYEECKGRHGWDLVENAITWDMDHVVSFLLDSLPFNRQMTNRNGYNFLHIATRNDSVESAKILLENKVCDINARDRDGRTALLHASETNAEDVPELLLKDEGLDLDAVHPESGQNALFHAFERDNRATWVTILESGRMSCNSKDRNGRTMLSLSVSKGWVWNIARLLRMGADPRVEDDDGKTPLEHAKESGYDNIAEELEKAKFMIVAGGI